MQNIEQTIEQYDLLWANWRANNRTFEEFQGEIARLKLANEGQDEITNNNAQQIAATNQILQTTQAQVNALDDAFDQLNATMASLDSEVGDLAGMRGDLQSIRDALNSGDSTVLGLVGRIEYIEQTLESVNAHRLQINESLFRLQENIESVQRGTNSSPGSP
jgi:chromosome segregation ATPase